MVNAGKLTIAFETLGCRSNYADTVELQAAALERGAFPTDARSSADIYVLNTCSVTDAADREAHKLLRRARNANPEARIVAAGCLAEVKSEELLNSGLADLALGSGTADELIEAILSGAQDASSGANEEHSCRTKAMSDSIPGPGEMLGNLKMRARYSLRVQQGCDNYCTFCIVPQTKGPAASRRISDILGDIKQLEHLGYREVVLTGTNIGSFGKDTGQTLYELLDAVRELDPDLRIRLSSIDPNELLPEIIDLIAGSSLFCSHIHLSLQALSDRVLKRMNRRYTVDDVAAQLEHIQNCVGRTGIGADLIAGFPGESREEVEQAVEAFLELPISYLHVFPYSEREGTAATRLDASVPVAERQDRARRWRELSRRRRAEFYHSLIGSELDVILETELESGALTGTSSEYASVLIPQPSSRGWRPGMRETLRADRYDASEGKIICV